MPAMTAMTHWVQVRGASGGVVHRLAHAFDPGSVAGSRFERSHGWVGFVVIETSKECW
jgi:hypothetical protein